MLISAPPEAPVYGVFGWMLDEDLSRIKKETFIQFEQYLIVQFFGQQKVLFKKNLRKEI